MALYDWDKTSMRKIRCPDSRISCALFAIYKGNKLICEGTHCDGRLSIMPFVKVVNDQQTFDRANEWRQMSFCEAKRAWLYWNYMRACFDVPATSYDMRFSRNGIKKIIKGFTYKYEWRKTHTVISWLAFSVSSGSIFKCVEPFNLLFTR